MIMKYIQDRGEKAPHTVTARPHWVSTSNASIKAWEHVERSKREKEFFIKTHHHATDYLVKANYLIKPSEVAKAIGVHRSTLMHSSSYSDAFSEYLESINAELETAKSEAIARGGKSRGTIPVNKDDLLATNKELKARLLALELRKTEELVAHAFDQLPLPIKKKLGIA